jgi:hypothetical protein
VVKTPGHPLIEIVEFLLPDGVLMFLPVVPGTVVYYLDPRTFSQGFYGLGEGELFHIHEETGYGPSLMTAETVIELPFRVHGKRGGLFVVKRTAAPIPASPLFQADILVYHRYGVQLVVYFLYGYFGNPHQPPLPLT